MDLDDDNADLRRQEVKYFRCLTRSLLAISIGSAALYTVGVLSPVYAVDHYSLDDHTLIGTIRIKVSAISECANPTRPYSVCRTYKPADWSCADMRGPLQAAFAFAVFAILACVVAAAHGTYTIVKERALLRHLDTFLAFAHVVCAVVAWLTVDRAIAASECEKVDPSREPPNTRRTYEASFHAGFALLVLPSVVGAIGGLLLVLRRYFSRCLWVDCCDTPPHPDDRIDSDEETGAPRALQMRSYEEVVDGATVDEAPTDQVQRPVTGRDGAAEV
jgi:hypothetical protein